MIAFSFLRVQCVLAIILLKPVVRHVDAWVSPDCTHAKLVSQPIFLHGHEINSGLGMRLEWHTHQLCCCIIFTSFNAHWQSIFVRLVRDSLPIASNLEIAGKACSKGTMFLPKELQRSLREGGREGVKEAGRRGREGEREGGRERGREGRREAGRRGRESGKEGEREGVVGKERIYNCC